MVPRTQRVPVITLVAELELSELDPLLPRPLLSFPLPPFPLSLLPELPLLLLEAAAVAPRMVSSAVREYENCIEGRILFSFYIFFVDLSPLLIVNNHKSD